MVNGSSREETWIAVHLVPKWLSQPEFEKPSDFRDSDEWIYYGPYWSIDKAQKSLEECGWYTCTDGGYNWRAERRRGFFMVAKICTLPIRRGRNRLPQDFVKKAESLAKEKKKNGETK